ncbi:MAG: hypothetical protein JOZ54_13325 [Acidobacteria bacterium]|nr:hypothetical protein [Acidobacteriota bacterium]
MRIRALIFGALVLALPAFGQLFRGGDQIALTIEHPATVKTPIDHIAFTQPQGPCAEAFSDALVDDFSTSGTIVIDRAHLKSIVAEHKINVSGLVDSKTAARIGRLIGAGSLVFIKVHECKTYHTQEVRTDLDIKGDVQKEKVPTTRGLFRASVQIVNMTTGVTTAAPMIDAKAIVHAGDKSSMKEKVLGFAGRIRHQATGVESPYPPDEDVHSELFAKAVLRVHRTLFSWREQKKITFYNDRECGLNNAYTLLQTSDYDGATRAARSSVETCQSTSAKPAARARAHYNLGMSLYLSGDYSGAMKSLAEASRQEPSKAISEAMAETNRAWSDTQAEQIGKKSPPPRAPTPAAEPAKTPATQTTEDRLRALEDLHRKKLITDDEYEKKRRAILESM